MSGLYTLGTWTVKPGREDEFIAAWQDLADWTTREVPGAGWATLIQHRDRPNAFVSFGPWESAEAVDAWRAQPGFQERVAALRDLLEGFEPGSYDVRAQVGQ